MTSRPANKFPRPADIADGCRSAELPLDSSSVSVAPFARLSTQQTSQQYTSDEITRGRHPSADSLSLWVRYYDESTRLGDRLSLAEYILYTILLSRHFGLSDAIPGRLLVDEFNDDRPEDVDDISLRGVQEAVHAIRNAGLLVGSSTKAGGGYFIPATYEEAVESNDALKRRASRQWRVVSMQKRAVARCFDQLQLFAENAA